MKNCLIILITFVLATINLVAQNEDDAIRYARLVPIGTARFSSMGGAFGALGGDLSCTAFNPAGIGVFRSSQMTFSGAWSTISNKTNFNGTANNNSNSVFNLSNIGFVISSPVNDGTGWKYLNFSMTYNQLANYDRNVSISGNNNFSSFIDQETTNANLYGTTDNLFYEADLIFTLPNSSTYINDYILANKGHNSFQSKSIRSKGSVGEYDFNISANLNDRVFIGASLGLMRAKYEETSVYEEKPNIEGIDLIDFSVTDYFNTVGNGFNLKAGMIYWINDFLRVGGAIHTPTIYSMHDNYKSQVKSKINYFDETTNTTEIDDKDVSSDPSFYDWELTTPFKVMGSTSFIFNKLGSISIDYEYINYSLSSLNAEDDAFTDVNNTISEIYQSGSNIRIGGEFNVGPISFRGGLGYYDSPYVSGQANDEANYMVYSGGIGFKSKEAFIDFGFSHSQMDEKYFLYSTPDSKADISNKRNTFITTIGFKF